jgi:cysteine desulfurase/selenocysteine lyase
MTTVSGCILDLKPWVDRTHQAQATFVLDAAQLVAHRPLDVAACGVDFAAFSSHKLYGPTGIGILYVDAEYLQQMQPVMGGGDMIEHVDIRGFRPTATPQRFEAGTPAITQAVGLSAALDYLEGLGWSSLLTHEHELTRHIRRVLGNIRGVRPLFDSTVRDPEREGGLFSFNVEGLHPHDIAQLLDSHNIAVRAGHHCAMPLHTTLGVSGSVRVSFGVYTTTDEIDALAEALESIVGWYGNERMTPS